MACVEPGRRLEQRNTRKTSDFKFNSSSQGNEKITRGEDQKRCRKILDHTWRCPSLKKWSLSMLAMIERQLVYEHGSKPHSAHTHTDEAHALTSLNQLLQLSQATENGVQVRAKQLATSRTNPSTFLFREYKFSSAS